MDRRRRSSVYFSILRGYTAAAVGRKGLNRPILGYPKRTSRQTRDRVVVEMVMVVIRHQIHLPRNIHITGTGAINDIQQFGSVVVVRRRAESMRRRINAGIQYPQDASPAGSIVRNAKISSSRFLLWNQKILERRGRCFSSSISSSSRRQPRKIHLAHRHHDVSCIGGPCGL